LEQKQEDIIVKMKGKVKQSFGVTTTKKEPWIMKIQGSQYIPGGVLLSHKVTQAVPSAQEGLTTLFGMGRGVTPLPKPPEKKSN
jgi:hypothetical protein